jgi:NTP pyrophosphatase (non-canonical NTP hydrolase)
MEFDDYQKKAKTTAVYPKKDNPLWYPALGLAGEAGEVADKVKKIMRDHGGKVSDVKRQELVKELGDVLWYMAMLAAELGVKLDLVASENIRKITSRKVRGVLHGEGDNR